MSNQDQQLRAPKMAGYLGRLLAPVDRLFDWLYGSEYNPLYRSGTLASGLLAGVILSGFYLLFFYRVSAPYESIQAIQGQIWFGRWIRAFHRYASDAAVLAVVFHILRMLIEGKTWGPRTLAWISGLMMAGVMLFSGWSGFVMVWDRHGQEMALTGARMLEKIPIFKDIILRSFSGVAPLPASFFFMNLFLHVALPLGMIIGLWIHTLRLNRPAWVPERSILKFTTLALVLLSILVPAPMGAGPDLLAVGGRFPVDWFYGFIFPLDWYASPLMNLLFWGGLFVVLVSMSWWWKPPRTQEPKKSLHDQTRCEGCNQCAMDCPFDAIEMVPRTLGQGSEIVAQVQESHCVGCGICAGSCSQFAIGPQGRSGLDQLKKIKELKAVATKGSVVYIYCSSNSAGSKMLEPLRALSPDLAPFPVECTGSLHPGVVANLQGFFDSIFVLGCPPRACLSRDGQRIFHSRVFEGQNPAQPERLQTAKILACNKTSSEQAEIIQEFKKFIGQETRAEAKTKTTFFGGFLKKTVATSGILLFIAFFSQFPGGTEYETGFLRLAFRIPGLVQQACRDLTPEELAARPAHMRRPRECVNTALSYHLKVVVDGRAIIEEDFHPRGARADKPLFVDRDFAVGEGSHEVKVEFVPMESSQPQSPDGPAAVKINYQFREDFKQGRAVLVSYNPTTGVFYHLK